MCCISPENNSDFKLIKKLYKKSFPRSERKPFSIIKRMYKIGKSDILMFYDEDLFIGFSITILGTDKVLVDYFAVSTDLRGKGYGTMMLNSLLERYLPKGVLLEIETPVADAPDYSAIIRRRNFYLKAGFALMNVRVYLFGVDMELLGYNCALGYDEYRRFYLDNYSKYVYNNIKKYESR